MRPRSFAQEQITHRAETKTGPLCSSHLHKGPALSCLCRDTERLQRTFQILWKVSLCVRVATRRRQSLSRGYDYFFFFEVFFATFLVAAFAVFLAFFAFLAMSSSVRIWLSEHAHVVDRHAQHRDDITKARLIPTHREAVLESLAGGTRSRGPPSLHAGVAITVPRSGALLTGLATAVGPASRRVPRRRDADAPAAAFFSRAWLAPTNSSLPLGKLMGSAPRARQGKAPANAGTDPSGIPGLPRFLTS